MKVPICPTISDIRQSIPFVVVVVVVVFRYTKCTINIIKVYITALCPSIINYYTILYIVVYYIILYYIILYYILYYIIKQYIYNYVNYIL